MSHIKWKWTVWSKRDRDCCRRWERVSRVRRLILIWRDVRRLLKQLRRAVQRHKYSNNEYLVASSNRKWMCTSPRNFKTPDYNLVHILVVPSGVVGVQNFIDRTVKRFTFALLRTYFLTTMTSPADSLETVSSVSSTCDYISLALFLFPHPLSSHTDTACLYRMIFSPSQI